MSHTTDSRTGSSSGQRTILGVLVHLIGLVFGILGVGLVYLVADADFTESNARNALNWWVFVFGAGIAIVVMAFVLGAVVDMFVILAALLAVVLGFLGLGFSIWATVKAAGGEAWKYPLAPSIL